MKQYLIKTFVTTDDPATALVIQNSIAKIICKGGEHFNVFEPIEMNTARIEQVRAYAKEQYASDAVLSEGEDGPWIQAWFFIPKDELEDDMDLDADQLDAKYNPEGDGEHPMYRRWNWTEAVAAGETIVGYWDWLVHKLSEKKEFA